MEGLRSILYAAMALTSGAALIVALAVLWRTGERVGTLGRTRPRFFTEVR
jgi:hypothetical protein